MSEQRVDTARIFPKRITLDGDHARDGARARSSSVPLTARTSCATRRPRATTTRSTRTRTTRGSQGAPTVFAMGMLPAGYLANAVSDWFGGPQHIRRFKVRFTTGCGRATRSSCSGRVVAIEDGLVKVTLEARRRGSGPEGLEPRRRGDRDRRRSRHRTTSQIEEEDRWRTATQITGRQGRTTPSTYEVTADAIEKYARATNDLNERYLGGDDVVGVPDLPDRPGLPVPHGRRLWTPSSRPI